MSRFIDGYVVGISDALKAISSLPTSNNKDVMEGQDQAFRAVEIRLHTAWLKDVKLREASWRILFFWAIGGNIVAWLALAFWTVNR